MGILDLGDSSSTIETTSFRQRTHNDSAKEATHCNLREIVGPYDVLCGRDKLAFNNIGNRRMRVLMTIFLTRYLEAKQDKAEKSKIIKTVVDTIRSGGGRFLKWCGQTQTYVELTAKRAHAKCSHSFRDMVAARVATSNRHQKRPMKPSLSRCLVPIYCKLQPAKKESKLITKCCQNKPTQDTVVPADNPTDQAIAIANSKSLASLTLPNKHKYPHHSSISQNECTVSSSNSPFMEDTLDKILFDSFDMEMDSRSEQEFIHDLLVDGSTESFFDFSNGL